MNELFGPYLKKLRKERGFSQEYLMILCGWKGRGEYVGQFERGERTPSIPNILLLATAMGYTLDDEETYQLLTRAGYSLEDASSFMRAVKAAENTTDSLLAGENALRMGLSILANDLAHAVGLLDWSSSEPKKLAKWVRLRTEVTRLMNEFEAM
jgi:transcriptional regulator with XRE-family HTH domain